MNSEASGSLKRQWHIVRFLLDGHYVSTANIREHLLTLGMEAEMRTIQRDLQALAQIFPLECRRDCMPHSWRWQRPQGAAAGGLSLTQALTLRLVEEQLQDVMPPGLMQELQPFFLKARLATSGSAADAVMAEAPRSGVKPRGGQGITGPASPAEVILSGIRSVLGAVLEAASRKVPDSTSRSVLTEMAKTLRQVGLDELVEEF